MQKNGFTLPATTFFVIAFLAIPIIFWSVSFMGAKNNVKGASTVIMPKEAKGAYAVVYASSGTWDLNAFLCKDKKECVNSLTGGKRVIAISGGKVEGGVVSVNYDESWADYHILKIYVKSGWGFGAGSYKLQNAGTLPDGDLQIINNNSEEYQVVLINVSDTASKAVGPFTFTDK